MLVSHPLKSNNCEGLDGYYRLKKRACNCTPTKIQTVPKNSNSVFSEHWSQQQKLLIIISIKSHLNFARYTRIHAY